MVVLPKIRAWYPCCQRTAQAELARRRPVWSREQKAFAGAASSVALSFLAAQTWNWSLCDTHQAPKDTRLSEADEALLLCALDTALENFRQWTQAPASWWDECRNVRMPGFGDARHCKKKLDGFPLRLMMVSALWENVSLDELIMVTEMTDDCVKLKFVPLMESVQTRFSFPGGRILRTTVKPLLLGLVSSREVESVMKEPETMPDGSVVSVGVGLQSPLLLEKIQQSDVLKALASEPPSKGKVRSVDHTSGYSFEPLEDKEPFQKGKWRVHIVILSEDTGGLPAWALEMGIFYGTIDWFAAADKYLKRLSNT